MPTSTKSVYETLQTLLSHPDWNGTEDRVLGFDAFRMAPVFLRQPPLERIKSATPSGSWDALPVASAHISAIQRWFESETGKKPSFTTTADAVERASYGRITHEVRDFLAAEPWDKIDRIGEGNNTATWLTMAFGAPDDEATRATAIEWLLGAVERVVLPPAPNTSFLLVLQGSREAARVMIHLAGEWHGPMRAHRTQWEFDFTGSWVIDMELREQDLKPGVLFPQTKRRLTRTWDEIVPLHRKRTQPAPRQAVFYTIVEKEPLWGFPADRSLRVVQTHAAFPQWVEQHRVQIWAQALDLYKRRLNSPLPHMTPHERTRR